MKNLTFTTLAVVALTIFSTGSAQAQFSLGNLFGFGTPSYNTPAAYSNYGNYNSGYSSAACPNGRCNQAGYQTNYSATSANCPGGRCNTNNYGTYLPSTSQTNLYTPSTGQYNSYYPSTGNYNSYQPSYGSQYGTYPSTNTPCSNGRCPTPNYGSTTPYGTNNYGPSYNNPNLNNSYGAFYGSY